VKKYCILIFSFLCFFMIYGEVDQSLFIKISGRVKELRSIMEEKLFEADIQSDVVVAYDLLEDKVVFNVKTLPLENGEIYKIYEERNINNFVDIAKLEEMLPSVKVAKDYTILKWITIISMLLIMSITSVRFRKVHKKKKEKEIEKIENAA